MGCTIGSENFETSSRYVFSYPYQTSCRYVFSYPYQTSCRYVFSYPYQRMFILKVPFPKFMIITLTLTESNNAKELRRPVVPDSKFICPFCGKCL